MSILLAGALKGVGDGLQAYGRMSMEGEERRRRMQEERDMRLEVERERAELRGPRGGGSGGGVLSADLVKEGGASEEMLAAQMGMSVPEYRKFVEMERTGSDAAYRRDEGAVMDDEYGQQKVTSLPPGFEEFKARKRAERGKLLETYAFSDDTDKIAEGRQTDKETSLLGDAAKGDQGARDALLVSKGKDPRETKAEADKDDRTDPNVRGGGGAGGGGKLRVQSSFVNDRGVRVLIMSDGSRRDTGVKDAQFGGRIATLIAQMAKTDPFKFGKLPVDQQRMRAMDMIAGELGDVPSPSPSPSPSRAPDPAAPDMSKANAIRQQVRDGKISRDEGLKQLRALGFK